MNKVQSRFWDKVKKSDGCWEWQGAVGSHGYGNFYDGTKYWTAHRYSHFMNKGDIGLFVLHSCDNKRCVNPAHLRSGTAKENTADMVKRGQITSGEKSYWSKLTENDVLNIRKLYRDGVGTQEEIGRKYGVGQAAIFKIIHKQRWKHI